MGRSRHLDRNSLLVKTDEENLDRPGCYLVSNEETGQAYVGSTVNIRSRSNAHRNSLNNNKSKNPKLQEAFNENNNFHIYPMFTDTVEEARALEQQILDECLGDPLFLNLAIDSIKGGVPGVPKSEEHRKKMSEVNKGKKLSEETKKKISDSLKALPPREDYSYLHTPEAIEKNRLARIGQKHTPEKIEKRMVKIRGQKRTPEQIERMRQAQLNKAPPTEEARRNMSEAQKRRIQKEEHYDKNRAIIVLDGKEYHGIKRAAVSLGIHPNTVTQKLKRDENCYYVRPPSNMTDEQKQQLRYGPHHNRNHQDQR